jgi:hypothetical protein
MAVSGATELQSRAAVGAGAQKGGVGLFRKNSSSMVRVPTERSALEQIAHRHPVMELKKYMCATPRCRVAVDAPDLWRLTRPLCAGEQVATELDKLFSHLGEVEAFSPIRSKAIEQFIVLP